MQNKRLEKLEKIALGNLERQAFKNICKRKSGKVKKY